MSTVLTYIFNTLIGVIGSAFLVSQLNGKQSISTGEQVTVGIALNGMALIYWLIVVGLYFFIAKKFLGKTVGGLITDKLMNKR